MRARGAIGCTAIALATACGGAAGRGSVRAGGGEHGAEPPARAGWLDGAWRWTHASEDGSVRRVEVEDWSLGLEGGVVTGSYDRQVVVMALDGVPFTCSQSLVYRLSTRYQVRGRTTGDGVEIDEVAYSTTPSPCESGHRGTTRYRVRPVSDGVELSWRGGRQTLRRVAEPPVPAPPPPGTRGSWRWTNRVVDQRGAVRVERESWNLDETEDGEVRGSYERRVSLYGEDGVMVSCSGGAVDFTDRYDVRGWRNGDAIVIEEIAAHPASTACGGAARHLDTAEGRVYPGSIELTWRGRNRQVLDRVLAQ